MRREKALPFEDKVQRNSLYNNRYLEGAFQFSNCSNRSILLLSACRSDLVNDVDWHPALVNPG